MNQGRERVYDLVPKLYGYAIPYGLHLKNRICGVENPRRATSPAAVFALQLRLLRHNSTRAEIVNRFSGV